jgi:hypothetical protein
MRHARAKKGTSVRYDGRDAGLPSHRAEEIAVAAEADGAPAAVVGDRGIFRVCGAGPAHPGRRRGTADVLPPPRRAPLRHADVGSGAGSWAGMADGALSFVAAHCDGGKFAEFCGAVDFRRDVGRARGCGDGRARGVAAAFFSQVRLGCAGASGARRVNASGFKKVLKRFFPHGI